MFLEQSDVPAITVDVKQNRVRIYRHTLSMLEDPKYIQLLYNSDEGIIGIQGFEEKPKHQWHKVRYEKVTSQTPYAVHSKYLINVLKQSLPVNDQNAIVRISGMLHAKQKLTLFRLSDAKIIHENDMEDATGT